MSRSYRSSGLSFLGAGLVASTSYDAPILYSDTAYCHTAIVHSYWSSRLAKPKTAITGADLAELLEHPKHSLCAADSILSPNSATAHVYTLGRVSPVSLFGPVTQAEVQMTNDTVAGVARLAVSLGGTESLAELAQAIRWMEELADILGLKPAPATRGLRGERLASFIKTLATNRARADAILATGAVPKGVDVLGAGVEMDVAALLDWAHQLSSFITAYKKELLVVAAAITSHPVTSMVNFPSPDAPEAPPAPKTTAAETDPDSSAPQAPPAQPTLTATLDLIPLTFYSEVPSLAVIMALARSGCVSRDLFRLWSSRAAEAVRAGAGSNSSWSPTTADSILARAASSGLAPHLAATSQIIKL